MLTRIEIDGFKTFRDFALDVPPFLVVLGRNAAGKSNLFDALQFLRLLADGSLLEAAQHARGEVTELFHRYSDGGRATCMTFAAEVLLDRSVTDAFGDTAPVGHSRLRYEVSIELRESRGLRPYVVRESVRPIRRSEDTWIATFAPGLAVYSSRTSDLLETDTSDPARPKFVIRQQKGAQGRPRELPASEATATVLSSLTTANEFPLLYALRAEFRSWKLLHLDPTALRAADSYDDPDVLGANGAHLANALRRIAQETGSADRPDGVLNDLSADLAAVIPEVVGVGLDEDEARRQRQVQVVARDEAPFSARVASDGTLRAIALLAALYDPRGPGLICFEESENGIYPERLAQFVRHLRTLVDRSLERRLTDDRSSLNQLILSSHSPAILRALRSADGTGLRRDVVFVDTAAKVTPGSPKSRVTRVRGVSAMEQTGPGLDVGAVVSPAEIADFEVSEALGV
ncbi:AAA family ATPase [Rhizomonospora bruguierae]|uniref:AAA family ATPase n=1 Tax=Rhizomonospora bruguierae TaxID=1581705 RepID=UPI001BD0DE7E|nr:AAA family ATPase [Micromonospora sp. NBRC 107566]